MPSADQRKNDVLGAAGLMLLSAVFFVALAALVKQATSEATPMQAVLFRSVFSALPLAVVMRAKRIGFWSQRWRMLLVRGGFGFCALYVYLWAVAHVPLANVLSLQQTSPILVAFLSVFLLGERPAMKHYLLAILCFAGVLLIVRPSLGLVSLQSTAALGSASLSSVAYIAVRSLTRTEPTERIVLWFSGVATVVSAPIAAYSWTSLSWGAYLLLVGAGLLAVGAQVLMTAAYRRAPAHVASAFSYGAVPLAYTVGIVFWAETPDILSSLGILAVAVGGALIVLTVRRTRLQGDGGEVVPASTFKPQV